MEKAIFIFTPSHQQQKYLERMLDSISENISIPHQFCLFTDELNIDFYSKYDILIKTINNEDLTKMQNAYFKENRGDIPAFSAYAQFVLPRYFSEFEKFIYLEVDQIVQGDIAPLWRYCINSGKPLSAVEFYGENLKPSTVKSFNNIHPGQRCFNTGVLFVDVLFWLEHDFEALCFKELELQQVQNGKRLDFYAQGAINNALHEYIQLLSIKYNYPCLGSVRGLPRKQLMSAILLHWTGPRKPWSSNGLYKDLYYKDKKYYNWKNYYSFDFLLNTYKVQIKKIINFLRK